MKRVRAVVTGRVQGVGFRYAANLRAEQFGISGFVRNLRDGTVEAELQGEAAAVDSMLEWFSKGPRAAFIETITSEEIPVTRERGFDIR